MNEILIGMKDVRKKNWCAKGARTFCAKHGISWDQFRHDKTPISVMRATGDSMALQLVEAAELEVKENGR